MKSYTSEQVRQHIRLHHPGCPEFAVEYFVAEVVKRQWTKTRLGQAVGITMQSILRHQMTDYDQLLLSGVDHHEARRRVRPRVNAMIQSWSKKTET